MSRGTEQQCAALAWHRMTKLSTAHMANAPNSASKVKQGKQGIHIALLLKACANEGGEGGGLRR